MGFGAPLLTTSAPAPGSVGSLERTLEGGILTGVAAAGAMGLFTMIAAGTYLDLGFYTPMYQVAAIVEPGPLQESMQQAAAGFGLYLELGAAVAGGAVHLGIGAGFGAVFAVLARVLRLRGIVAAAAGAAYGLAVMGLMGKLVLPSAAGQTAGGSLIAEVPSRLGWPTFAVAHLIFGLALGAWAALRPADPASGAQDGESG